MSTERKLEWRGKRRKRRLVERLDHEGGCYVFLCCCTDMTDRNGTEVADRQIEYKDRQISKQTDKQKGNEEDGQAENKETVDEEK